VKKEGSGGRKTVADMLSSVEPEGKNRFVEEEKKRPKPVVIGEK